VVGIEYIVVLTAQSALAQRDIHADELDSQGIVLVMGDGRLGYPPKCPYDAIHVSMAAMPIPPTPVMQWIWITTMAQHVVTMEGTTGTPRLGGATHGNWIHISLL